MLLQNCYGIGTTISLSDPTTIDRTTMGLRLFYPGLWKKLQDCYGIERLDNSGYPLPTTIYETAMGLRLFYPGLWWTRTCLIPATIYRSVLGLRLRYLLSDPTTIDRNAMGLRTDNSGYTRFYSCLQHCSWVKIILPMANPGSLSLTIETRSFGSWHSTIYETTSWIVDRELCLMLLTELLWDWDY